MPAATTETPLYEGKAKRLFDDGHTLRVEFKDEATAFNGEKHAFFTGKGALNAQITAKLFDALTHQGLPTCFLQRGDTDNTLVYQRLQMIPLEVVVRNVALGSFAKRYGLQPNSALAQPQVETFLKRDDLNDPLIPPSAVDVLNVLPSGIDIATLERYALAANTVFTALFHSVGVQCADFKLEFGLTETGELCIADELSPDNFRLRDEATGQILDKDTFRLEEGNLLERYQTVWDRLQAAPTLTLPTQPYQVDVVVTGRKNVLNPESRTLTEQIQLHGFKTVDRVLCHKQFTLTVNASHAQAAFHIATQLADSVLANPVVEDAHILPTVTLVTAQS